MSDGQTISYKTFVREYCVRDSQYVTKCLLAKFQKEIISLSLKMSNLRRLIVTNGNFSDFNSELFDKVSSIIEQEVETLLLQTDEGKAQLTKFGPIFNKQLSFCGFCFRLGLEEINNQIEDEKAKLIYIAIMNYYLANRLLNISSIQQLKNKLVLKRSQFSKTDDFIDQEISLNYTDIPELKSDQIELIKEYLESDVIRDIINGIENEPELISNENEEIIEVKQLPKMGTETKQNPHFTSFNDELLLDYQKQCIECMKTIDLDECIRKSELVIKIIEKGNKAIIKLWNEQIELRPCIANEFKRRKE